MLILTRRVRERIVIDRRIEVTVLEVQGDVVRLGITAPREIEVHRHELLAGLTAENRGAATSAARLAPGNQAIRRWLGPAGGEEAGA